MRVPVERLVYATHDMAWCHVERWRKVPAEARPPILVEYLEDAGRWFVHDGRHRAEAACEDGAHELEAVLLY